MTQFAIRNLSVLDYAQGFTEWHYRAPNQPLAEIMADGFFQDAEDMIATGDIILTSALDGGAMLYVSTKKPKLVTKPMART